MKFRLLLILFTSVYFISYSCKTTLICGGGVGFQAIGFDSSDIYSILFVEYRQNNVFDSVIDTIRYGPGGYMLSRVNFHDTSSLDIGAFPGYDYKLIFPNLGRTYSITKLRYTKNLTEEAGYECGRGPENIACSNPFIACTVNGLDFSYNSTDNLPIYRFTK